MRCLDPLEYFSMFPTNIAIESKVTPKWIESIKSNQSFEIKFNFEDKCEFSKK